MYKVYADGVLYCDSSVPAQAIISPKVTIEANTAGTFTFTIPPDHPKYNTIQRRKTVIKVVMDGESEPIFQGYCTEESVDFYLQKTYVCEGELAYLNDSILRQHHYQGETVLSLLTAYINQHNQQVDAFKRFEVGTVTVSDSNDYISCYTNYNTTMQEIKGDLVDDLGGYLRVRYANGKKYIDYLEDSPHPATQTIQLGVNLVDYKSNINDTEIATAIIPLGEKGEQVVEGLDSYVTIESVNSGKDYVYSQQAVNTYGWIFRTVEWSNVTTPAALKTKAEAYLADVQFADVTIEARAVDLSMIGEADSWHLLDSIHVISAAHGMDRWFTLTKMEYDLNAPENNTVTLGTIEKNTLTTKTAQTNSETLKKIEELPKSSAITNAINSVTNKITGASGGYICINYTDDGRPYELLIMDTDSTSTARKVWRWNQNGLGYSKTGYNGTYETAITKDGEIVANFITSGQMNANRIVIGNDPLVDTINDLDDKADAAQSAADSASSAASSAASAAATAQSTAEGASSAASSAQSAASAAQSTANSAQSTANDAKSKTDGLATGTTIINGGCIQTGTIDANLVNVINILAENIDIVEKAYAPTDGWSTINIAFITAYLIGNITLEDAIRAGADINGDGNVDFFDLALGIDALLNRVPWDEAGGTFKAQIKCENPFSAMSVSDNGKTAFSAGIHGAFMANGYVGDSVKVYDSLYNGIQESVTLDKYGLRLRNPHGDSSDVPYDESYQYGGLEGKVELTRDGLKFIDKQNYTISLYPRQPLSYQTFSPATGTASPFQITKYLNVVDLYGGLNGLPSGSTSVNLGTLPYKPRNTWAVIPTYSTAAPYLQVGTIWISNTGAMTLYKSSTHTGCYFGGTFVCQN